MSAEYGFVVTLADEGVVQLEACLGFLRAADPDAPCVVVSDGVADARYEAACARHRATYRLGRYLKRIECGGAWWRRTLEAGLELGTPWIVKLDPDARLWRPFRTPPPRSISGTLAHPGEAAEHVQGGCQAIAAAAARRILAAGLTEDPALADFWTLTDNRDVYREWNARAYFSTDLSLAWMARHLGIPLGDWPEVASVWQPPAPANDGLAHAATHPHKLTPGAAFRGAPLHVITTCKGRLAHLKETLPRWLAEPGVTATVVDYGCPEGAGDWVRANHPDVRVVRVRPAARFNLAAARNAGAAGAPEGWWCFWDADCRCEPGWADAVRGSLRHRTYLLARPIDWGQFGSVVVHSADFRRAGGYDDLFRAWGSEDSEFYLRLRHTGIRPGAFPGGFTRALPHDEAARTRFYDVKRIERSRVFYDHYIRRKRRFLADTGRIPDRAECRAMLAEAARAHGDAETQALYLVPEETVQITVEGPGPDPAAAVAGAAAPAADAAPAVAGDPAAVAAAAPVAIHIVNHGAFHLNLVHAPAEAVQLGHSANATAPAGPQAPAGHRPG